MADQPLQASLFEEDYLVRELGQLARVPQISLTELVANAWDAGATHVHLTLPGVVGGKLVVEDDGHGMTPEQFRVRWMTLRYDRLKHQGQFVEVPPGRRIQQRRPFGRNGVGRHGLLCFDDSYEVQTWRDGVLTTFVVGTESGPSPFVLRSETSGLREGCGTRLSVNVMRNLPDPGEILTVLATRFIHDPEFKIKVNGRQLEFHDLVGVISDELLDLGDGRSAKVIVIDSTRLNHSSIHQGVAFWVRHRLVGAPSWSIGSDFHIDGRSRFARRYKVIVDTEGYESEVLADWTGFHDSVTVRKMFMEVANHLEKVTLELAKEVAEEASEEALAKNRKELVDLGKGARFEVAEFTRGIAQAHPTVSPDFLATAVKAVINLEKSKSGSALLQQLSEISSDDVCRLESLLSNWSLKDALSVLDEIDVRISTIEAIKHLASDRDTDELHTLHPLILRSRWLFGPEYESPEYTSNATLQTVAKELFKRKDVKFVNGKQRPDIVVLPDDHTTWQMTGIEEMSPVDSGLVQIRQVLVIELKRGGFEITRDEVNQASGYVQDIHGAATMSGNPFVHAWVVGHSVKAGTEREARLGDPVYGRVSATTYASLVDTANTRLLRLRTRLAERYDSFPRDELLDRVLKRPEQWELNV